MHFKVISDLHVDINRIYKRDMKFDPNAFYLIAGDVSGDRLTTHDFLISKDIKGIFVEGNHFGYNTTTDKEENDTKEYSIKYLENIFDSNFQLTFLENRYKEVEDCVIVGCTLYTNFELFGNQPLYAERAMQGMNDFRYVTTLTDDGEIRRVTAWNYINWFNRSIDFIDKACEKFKDKKIVVVTHHAPSIKGISKEYVNDSLTPAYASNLERFIIERPQIKLWCHGHVHHINQYNIGETKVICNPFGYYNENGMDLNNDLGIDVEI